MTLDWTTILPLICLGAGGAIVPWLLMRIFPDTQHGLLQALAVSVVVLILAGTLIFVALYAEAGLDVARLAEAPWESLRHFIRLGLLAMIIWVPILLLAAFSFARGIEARRSQQMAARDRD